MQENHHATYWRTGFDKTSLLAYITTLVHPCKQAPNTDSIELDVYQTSSSSTAQSSPSSLEMSDDYDILEVLLPPIPEPCSSSWVWYAETSNVLILVLKVTGGNDH